MVLFQIIFQMIFQIIPNRLNSVYTMHKSSHKHEIKKFLDGHRETKLKMYYNKQSWTTTLRSQTGLK